MDADAAWDCARSAVDAALKRRSPWTVGITDTCEVLGRFTSEGTAEEFIATLPEYLTGRYFLDGPMEED